MVHGATFDRDGQSQFAKTGKVAVSALTSHLIDFCLLAITSLSGHFILILAQVKTENLGSSHLSMKDSDGLQNSAKRVSRAFQPIANRADATTTSLRLQDFQTNSSFIMLHKAQHHFVALPLHLTMDGSWNSQ